MSVGEILFLGGVMPCQIEKVTLWACTNGAKYHVMSVKDIHRIWILPI